MDSEDRDERGALRLNEAQRPPDPVTMPPCAPSSGNNNEWTLQRVYMQCAPFIYRTLQQLGVRLDDLDDMLHDVFLVVHQHLDSFDRTRTIKPWLYGICKKKVLNYRRRPQCEHEVLVPDVPELGPEGTGPNAEQMMLMMENIESQRLLLTALLDELELDQRAILVMRHIDGMRYVQIAEVFDIPVATVGTQLRTALKALKLACARRKARLAKGGRK